MISYQLQEHYYFCLFPNAVLVKGANAGIICDLHTQKYIQVPLNLCQILDQCFQKNIAEVLQYFGNEYDVEIKSFLHKLVDTGFAFYTTDTDRFPAIDFTWKSPSEITHAIIHISDKVTEKVFKELENLGCQSLELRSLAQINKQELLELLAYVKTSMVYNIDLILPYFEDHETVLREVSKKNLRINTIILYNSPVEKQYELRTCTVLLKMQNMVDKHCGVISADYFTSELKLYAESLEFNSCLNRKISVDAQGNIKNCPSMSQSFGNIQETTLHEALAHPDFKKTWSLNKDKIHVCKDCEFRHICTDCRAYIEEPDDLLSKPLKCGYNPYTGAWSEWSQNPLKQKAIEHYGMQEILPVPKP